MFFFRPSFHYCSSGVHHCEDRFHISIFIIAIIIIIIKIIIIVFIIIIVIVMKTAKEIVALR